VRRWRRQDRRAGISRGDGRVGEDRHHLLNKRTRGSALPTHTFRRLAAQRSVACSYRLRPSSGSSLSNVKVPWTSRRKQCILRDARAGQAVLGEAPCMPFSIAVKVMPLGADGRRVWPKDGLGIAETISYRHPVHMSYLGVIACHIALGRDVASCLKKSMAPRERRSYVVPSLSHIVFSCAAREFQYWRKRLAPAVAQLCTIFAFWPVNAHFCRIFSSHRAALGNSWRKERCSNRQKGTRRHTRW